MDAPSTPQNGAMMTLPDAVRQALRKYADFSGRASRPEYWWWVLATVIASLILGTLDTFIVSLIDRPAAFSPLNGIFWLAVLLPCLAVSARRLHDIGKTGWWILLWFVVALFGWIPVVVGIAFAALAGVFSGIIEESAVVVLAVGAIVTVLVQLGLILWVILWMARQGQSGVNSFSQDPRPSAGLMPSPPSAAEPELPETTIREPETPIGGAEPDVREPESSFGEPAPAPDPGQSPDEERSGAR
jgi:uncharacterized membrane protein YhaH (DUF805 family)